MRVLLLGSLVCSIGCGAATGPLDGPLPPLTAAELPAAPCHGDDPVADPPPAGTKRVELHVATNTAETWLTVDGKTSYKQPEHHDACYALDLVEGPHQVSLRAHASQGGGLGVALTAAEYGTGTKAWYDFFRYSCGIPGACDADDFRAWQEAAEKDRTIERDACSASRPSMVRWQTGKLADTIHPGAALLTLTLDVDARVPTRPPGDQDCVKR